MRRLLTIFAVVTTISLLAAACGGSDPTPTPTRTSPTASAATATPTATAGPAPEGAALPIENFAHLELTVEAGTPVTWTNLDGAPHTVTAGAPGNKTGAFDSGSLSRGETFTQTFDQKGSFAYFCAIHTNMRATVTVVGAGEAPSGDGSPAAAAGGGYDAGYISY